MPNTDGSRFNGFYKDYVKSLDDRQAALFIGAGLSIPAGFKSWPDLLRGVAAGLQLDVEKESDLIALAQFHVNEKKIRTHLNQLIVDEYDQDVPVTRNHRLIANLPIETVWTTNYDQLIEKAFREAGKRCETKVTSDNFGITLRGKDVTLYKMHGDVTQPQDAILTKEDYELYTVRGEVFINALKGDLVNKTFLFLGFSFTDPNMDYILTRIRLLMGRNPRQHYCVMRRPKKPRGGGRTRAQYDYDMVRLGHRISDLKRYGIEALMIDAYDEITQILETLNKRAHRNNIFVSGSAQAHAPMEQQRVEQLAYQLGQQIIRRDFNLVSGFGLGIGGTALIGAAEEVYRDEKATLSDRVLMRPFPQLPPGDPRRKQLYRTYRRDMLSKVGYTIFLCGNKLDPVTGEVVPADGVREEFEITKELGKFPIPVGTTGDVAREIWEEVAASPETFFPGADIKKHLQVLGDSAKTNEEIIEAIFAIIKQTDGK